VCACASLKIAHHHYESFFDGDIVALHDREPFDFWRYTNADINFVRPVKDLLGFHVVRDPRDVIVSAYFSHYYSHPDEYWPRLRHYRPYLRSLAKRDGLLAEMEFNALFLAHMLMWDYTNPRILELRFEDMITDRAMYFERAFRHLGVVPVQLSVDALTEIVEKYSFERLSGGRRAGSEDLTSHYRRGVPGDWRSHFQPCHVEYFKQLYNPLLLKLGYETREDWT
jgi:hypothetical protein